MDSVAVVKASAVERRALAGLLEVLDDTQLTAPSLCKGWDVRTVAAHVAAALEPSQRPFVKALLRARGRMHRANDLLARDTARRPVGELARQLRERADSAFAPPVVGVRGPLVDVLVHTADIRVPLGLPHEPDPHSVVHGLDFVTAGRPVGFVPRRRLTGLRLEAHDADWAWGEGPVVSGRAVDILAAVCGRTALLPRLAGDGVPSLAGRMH